MTPSQAQREAVELLKQVVRAVDWTERTSNGEHIISDRGRHPITKIKTGYKSTKWASMRTPDGNRPLRLRVQTEWWEEASKEEQLGLIVHEATHIRHHHHKPEFWEVNIDLYRELSDHADFQDYDWKKVSRFAKDDPNRLCVDRRSETVQERKERMEVVEDFR